MRLIRVISAIHLFTILYLPCKHIYKFTNCPNLLDCMKLHVLFLQLKRTTSLPGKEDNTSYIIYLAFCKFVLWFKKHTYKGRHTQILRHIVVSKKGYRFTVYYLKIQMRQAQNPCASERCEEKSDTVPWKYQKNVIAEQCKTLF